MAQLLDRAASSLRDGPVPREEANAWLDTLRAITGRVESIERALDEASESRRLNPRAVGVPDTTPELRSGLLALEHAGVALRAVFRSLGEGEDITRDEARGDGDAGGAAEDAEHAADGAATDDELREVFAVLLVDIARAMRDFATLVRAEGDEVGEPHVAELEDALDAVREARVRLTELLLIDPGENPQLWQRRGALLAGVERVLAELDVEERRRRTRQRREQAAAARRPAAQAAERLRSTTRRVVAENPALRRPRRPRNGR
jgi:hypothetical protein